MRIRLSFLTASLLLSLVIGTVSVSAVSPVPLPNLEEEVDDRLRGVFITEVPQWECAIFCGSYYREYRNKVRNVSSVYSCVFI